jgi:integrase
MELTYAKIKSLTPKNKPYKAFDGSGLFLLVTPTSKLWRYRYWYGRSEKLISLGIYPEVSLKEARSKRDRARKLLSEGIDPSEARRKEVQNQINVSKNKFRDVASEWLLQQSKRWSAGHQRTVERRLELYVYPRIGDFTVNNLTPPELLSLLRPIEKQEKLETAHRVYGILSGVFRYAVASGRIPSDPTRDLKGALATSEKSHFSAITDPKEVSKLMGMISNYRGANLVVETALKMAPLVFVRPGELRQAEWAQIDLDRAEWRFRVSKTKTDHIVPLATQVVNHLRNLHPYTGAGKYVFPSIRSIDKPMSDNAILAAMRSLGIPKDQMCGHGFRAMARTLLDEELGFRPEIIEHQLAHAVRDPLGRAYNRTQHVDERRKMMQAWADYLENIS